MKTILNAVLAFALLSASRSFGMETTSATRFLAMVGSVPVAELPAKAAETVKLAKPNSRESVTVEVVKAAVSLNPNAAPAIVAAIARSIPAMAGIAAGTAAQAQPQLARLIARAAAAAAPAKAALIAAAVCRAVPNDCPGLAAAVVQGAPGTDKQILTAVVSAFSEPKLTTTDPQPINHIIISAPGGSVHGSAMPSAIAPVGQGLSGSTPGAFSGPLAGGPSIRGPTIAPPFTPLSGTVSNINPSTSGNLPSGGRNYAAP